MLSLPTALPPQDFYKGKQNQNSSVAFSEKPLEWEKKDEGVWGFLHIKTYSIYLSLPSPCLSVFQAVSNSKRADPKSNNP